MSDRTAWIVIGLTLGMFLCRQKWSDYAEEVFVGMANKIATVTIVAWFWAGMFAQVLRAGGLVDGLVWLGGASNATGGVFVGATFVLAAHAKVNPEVLRSRFPTQVKAGPVEKIQELVKLALPGIGLRPLPVAPRQIPYHSGFVYFELDSSSDYWKQLDKSGGFGLHVGGEFPELELELWAIRE